MAIHLLDDRVIAQIAAGEVIERPASVVKELVENAIDAGATYIHIEANEGGRRLIRVSDNGAGIAADEVMLALTRHATSKLINVEDLEIIRTLGFRGEALASIASVSQLILTTCYRDEELGTEIHIHGGDILSNKPIGAPAGTVISIENLFYNTPARLKFLKADTTERRHITSVVMNYALAYPHVRFLLEQDGRETLRTNGTGQLSDALVNIVGLDEFRQMVEVNSSSNEILAKHSNISVTGYTSTPDFSRGDRSRILLFVNGRAIQDSKLSYAVVQAYHTFLMTGRYPIAFLMIDVPTADVDVNVHPAKAEVRFRDPNRVFSAVQRAVRQAIVEESSPLVNVRDSRFQAVDADNRPRKNIPQTNTGTVQNLSQLEMNWDVQDSGQFARQRDLYNQQQTDDPTAIPEGLGTPQKPRTLPLLRVVGQIAAAYIVAEGPSGMYLIDQHAAHERILYEQFMEAYHNESLQIQQTLDAQTIQLSPVDAKLIEENMATIERMGFVLESFGANMFTVRGVPAILADLDPKAVATAIVSDLVLGQNPGEQRIEDKIVLRICKQAAVKAGQVLSLTEMQGIIRQLERCESPHTCPHGRPTILHMSADQLAREFGRAGIR